MRLAVFSLAWHALRERLGSQECLFIGENARFRFSLRMKRLRCLFPLETSLMCRMCCLWMRKRNGNFRLSVLPRFAVARLLFMMITRRWCMRAKRLRSLLLLRKRLRMLCCLLLSESCLTIFQMVRMC